MLKRCVCGVPPRKGSSCSRKSSSLSNNYSRSSSSSCNGSNSSSDFRTSNKNHPARCRVIFVACSSILCFELAGEDEQLEKFEAAHHLCAVAAAALIPLAQPDQRHDLLGG